MLEEKEILAFTGEKKGRWGLRERLLTCTTRRNGKEKPPQEVEEGTVKKVIRKG